MSMEIQIHSKLSIADTSKAISEAVEQLRIRYGDRFWFSDVTESSRLSKEILSEDFGFQGVCGFVVSDVSKEFDGLEVAARTLRNALDEQNAIVVYPDTGELFPKEDYA